MKEKVYEVLKGQKITGKHRVYTEGQQFKESELFGTSFGGLDLMLKGKEAQKAKTGEGNKVIVAAKKAIPAKIKEVAASEVKSKVKK